ncbi:ABC transporter ATP-binding protein [Labrys monachus]|uniref:Oligopeptide/dipeptide ABC transporter ATP-binding protein n=1 Tax=Labrys monachus TaxID=217067 RepID=A0ABU0FJY0_9HYPH|nr:ABC transporter ATP-binding protein [Labrys monachus]MDQ0394916.1 oligopeptide/dipeptide ABC transporter ATP-binding protein [Labrys monachus]
MSTLLALDGFSITFPGNPAGNATVDGVRLSIGKGEILALVGESGSGKSLLAHAIAGILTGAARIEASTFTFGGIDLRDRCAPGWRDLRGREIGIVFQNARAALNPVRKVGRQIADVLAEHRQLRGKALRQAAIEALKAVRIPDAERRWHAYPGELSGGMCQRVMLAIAMAGNPALLIADEPTTGLDTTTQAAILDLILAQARTRRMACILITHDLALAMQRAERVIVMHAGQVVEEGAAATLLHRPSHPYTQALIGATPAAARTVGELAGIPGSFPNLAEEVAACRFAGRCERVLARCRLDRPSLAGASHQTACWNPL